MNQTHVDQVDVLLDGNRSYVIHVGDGIISTEKLAPYIGSQAAVVTNARVAELHLQKVLDALPIEPDVIEIGDGEGFKTLDTYAAVIDELIEKRHNRTTTLIALGGGVVGDLAGFVAATYQRGVGFIQIPSTLLAQVDSSVGGKTAVNHRRGKNLIGAFYQPRVVVADVGLLETLPEREFLAGLAEVIKYGVIADAAFFGWLQQNHDALMARDVSALSHAVRRSCELKAEVVAKDEREGGLRMILNFGHTFGHAIEALTNYEAYLHGEAVAIGMVMAASLSARLGRLSRADADAVQALIDRFGLPTEPPQLSLEAWIGSMALDKKVVDGRMRFIVPDTVGSVSIVSDVTREQLEGTIAECIGRHG